MSTRPSIEEFFNWIKDDKYSSKVQAALGAYPDLVNVKNKVTLFSLFSVTFNLLEGIYIFIIITKLVLSIIILSS